MLTLSTPTLRHPPPRDPPHHRAPREAVHRQCQSMQSSPQNEIVIKAVGSTLVKVEYTQLWRLYPVVYTSFTRQPFCKLILLKPTQAH
mmetsp:Transcript_16049/g.21209  ORF Transcript_16049/g.21209 Transcript_16049/m.21209 type:complete len:88 (-) Transcript_16049:179-442(-)